MEIVEYLQSMENNFVFHKKNPTTLKDNIQIKIKFFSIVLLTIIPINH